MVHFPSRFSSTPVHRVFSQLAGCLAPLVSCDQIDSVVLGFDSGDQVADLDLLDAVLADQRVSFRDFAAVADPTIIDPRRWHGTA